MDKSGSTCVSVRTRVACNALRAQASADAMLRDDICSRPHPPLLHPRGKTRGNEIRLPGAIRGATLLTDSLVRPLLPMHGTATVDELAESSVKHKPTQNRGAAQRDLCTTRQEVRRLVKQNSATNCPRKTFQPTFICLISGSLERTLQSPPVCVLCADGRPRLVCASSLTQNVSMKDAPIDRSHVEIK